MGDVMFSNTKKNPVCPDSRECFAKKREEGALYSRCTVLQRANGKFYVNDGECTFCKPWPREATNGKLYPYDPYYGDERGAKKES